MISRPSLNGPLRKTLLLLTLPPHLYLDRRSPLTDPPHRRHLRLNPRLFLVLLQREDLTVMCLRVPVEDFAHPAAQPSAPTRNSAHHVVLQPRATDNRHSNLKL